MLCQEKMYKHSITWGNISSGLKHLFSVLCKSVFKAWGTAKSGRPLEISLPQLHVFRSKQCWVWTYFPNRHTYTQCIQMYVYIYAYLSDTDQRRKYSTHRCQQYEQPLILLSSLLDEAESLLVKNSDTYIYVKSLDPPVTDLGHPVYPVSGSLDLPIVSLTRRCTHWSLH